MHYAYNGKYFEYFEVGRTEMMREHGLTYKTIESNGYQMPVHEVELAFVKKDTKKITRAPEFFLNALKKHFEEE
jgi:acyl-CoA thioester hydrolase